jgi:hypothetical protein
VFSCRTPEVGDDGKNPEAAPQANEGETEKGGGDASATANNTGTQALTQVGENWLFTKNMFYVSEYQQVPAFLTGKKMAMVGLDEALEAELTDWIGEAGGELVFRDFQGTLDYLLVPRDFKTYDLVRKCQFKAKEVFTSLWLEDCLDQGKLLPLDLAYQPIIVDRELVRTIYMTWHNQLPLRVLLLLLLVINH